jgi:hypothetical protein
MLSQDIFAVTEGLHCEQEAGSAVGMNNMNVVDRQIKVETAKVAKNAKTDASNPFAALHMQQMVQIQMAQLHSTSLAAQVAAMRAQAKTTGATVVPGRVPLVYVGENRVISYVTRPFICLCKLTADIPGSYIVSCSRFNIVLITARAVSSGTNTV